jgi:hypothetical protein
MRDVRAARKLISVVQLTEVRLIELHTTNRLNLSHEIPSVTIEPSFKATASVEGTPGKFLVLASLDLQVKASEGENQPLVRIRAKFELRYRVPSDYPLMRMELAAFARVNGIYNAWPYFREIVQNITGRMGLPSLILPVYRIPRPKPVEAQAPQPGTTPRAEDVDDSKSASELTH